MQNKLVNGAPANYRLGYPATIVSDATHGYVARYEVRTGDKASSSDSGERSEVAAGFNTGGGEGDLRRYSFSTKFDPSFPKTWTSAAWGVTNQWHAEDSLGASPPVAFGYEGPNVGNWQLIVRPTPSSMR